MKLSSPENYKENWHEVLSLWNKVVTWQHYGFSDRELNLKLKSLVIFLWNEKDWLKKRFPSYGKKIEEYINNSQYIKIVADLANGLKHGGIDRNARSDSKQTDYFGKVTINSSKHRFMYYIENDDEILELFSILRGTIDEYDFIVVQARSNKPLKQDKKQLAFAPSSLILANIFFAC